MKVAIIGLGWLGLPLAKKLIALDFSVKGSTTSNEKLDALKQDNINAYKVFFTEKAIEGDISNCLEGCETLILNTPPGLRRNPNSNYVAKITALIPHIENATIKNVLFIGSTSVFKDGFPIPKINNQTLPNAETVAGKQLRTVETLLSSNPNFNTTILRFSGLVDDDRHPARMMSKRKAIPNAQAPVNLIHKNDCIGIITAILQQSKWGISLNAAYPDHPTKIEYYTSICTKLGYSQPDFDISAVAYSGKEIDGSELTNFLEYTYGTRIW